MTFLSRILETKREEVAKLHAAHIDVRNVPTLAPCRGFADHISASSHLAVVAEIKKASPSKGLIATDFRPVEQAKTYNDAGAAAISVLTDQSYFQGSIQDLIAVRENVSVPVLRKDFIIDEVQIDEARIAGADAVLLICAALEPYRLVQLSTYAASLGLDVLIEVHDVSEVEAALRANPSVLGINNRNLHTFEVSLDTTRVVMRVLPKSVLAISESGVFNRADALSMAATGVRGVLVGESLMRGQNTNEVACALAQLQVPCQGAGKVGRLS